MYTVMNVVLGYGITVTFICNESQVQEVLDFISVCEGSAVDIIEQVEANFDCRSVSPTTYDPFNWAPASEFDTTEDVDVEEPPLSDADILHHIFNYHLAIVSSSTEIPDLRMDIDADGRLIIFHYDQEQNILSANLTALDEEEEE